MRPPATCIAGVIRSDLLVLEHHALHQDPKHPRVEPALRIGSDGAWRYERETPNGKVAAVNAGCLAPSDLAILTRTLAAATWRTHRAEVTCAAVATEAVWYVYRGRKVLERQLCDGVLLDESTTRALAEITRITTPLEIDPQGKPPCEVCDAVE